MHPFNHRLGLTNGNFAGALRDTPSYSRSRTLVFTFRCSLEYTSRRPNVPATSFFRDWQPTACDTARFGFFFCFSLRVKTSKKGPLNVALATPSPYKNLSCYFIRQTSRHNSASRKTINHHLDRSVPRTRSHRHPSLTPTIVIGGRLRLVSKRQAAHPVLQATQHIWHGRCVSLQRTPL